MACPRCDAPFGEDVTHLYHSPACDNRRRGYGTVALGIEPSGVAQNIQVCGEGYVLSHIEKTQWDDLIARLDRIEKKLEERT